MRVRFGIGFGLGIIKFVCIKEKRILIIQNSSFFSSRNAKSFLCGLCLEAVLGYGMNSL